MPPLRLCGELGYESEERRSVVWAGATPVLRIRLGDRRAHVDVALLEGRRFVEVSFQPAAPADLVSLHARLWRADAAAWTAALRAAVADDATRWGLWSGPDASSGGDGLVRLLGAMTHPMLIGAYDAGAPPIPQLPRWAAAALAEPTVASCARRLFGPSATRAVVRALARFLTRPVLPWWPLALAVAAAPVVEPDHLARYLSAPLVDAAGGARPARDDVRTTEAGLALVGTSAAHRLVVEALDTAGGPERLVAALALLVQVQADLDGRLPGRLADLETACRSVALLDPTPPGPPRPRPGHARRAPARRPAEQPAAAAPDPVVVTAPPPALPPRPDWQRPRGAPRTAGRAPAPEAPMASGPIARVLAGSITHDVELVAPRTAAELVAWGRVLSNCLGGYAAAVSSGSTCVLGVRHRGALVAALEVRGGRVVQLLGPRNRPPPEPLARVVIRHVERTLQGA
jgi:hypothetical protein